MAGTADKVRNAAVLHAEGLGVSGWLFTNFSHRDSLTDRLLGLDTAAVSTRRWIYIIFASGKAVRIVHKIEASALDSLPADETLVYASNLELKRLLSAYEGQSFALLADEDIPVISTVDGGFIRLLESSGIGWTSAASLVQFAVGTLSVSAIESHERAAALLYSIVSQAWEFICAHYREKKELYERDVSSFILEKFAEYNLTTDHAPIVAFGPNAGNPHYEVPADGGRLACEGDIVQFDIWAKERLAMDDSGCPSGSAAVFADISWVGVYSDKADPEIERDFADLTAARDAAYEMLRARAADGVPVSGAAVDSAVRALLTENGYGEAIKHRTGHGIDTSCHGSGANLDSYEFPDKRLLGEGSCFSVEPGIYFDSYGMRTEINIYIHNGTPVISGLKYTKDLSVLQHIPQRRLLAVRP